MQSCVTFLLCHLYTKLPFSHYQEKFVSKQSHSTLELSQGHWRSTEMSHAIIIVQVKM